MSASRRRLALTLTALAMLPLAHAGWLHAKAQLAQVLLERAWRQAQHASGQPRPWPWADTTPIARLSVARLGVERIVLAGDSGRTLAFGPGWAPGSARPGEHGVVLISAHRDTHFAFLRELARGDRIALDGVHGSRRYRVDDVSIVDSRDSAAATVTGADGLVLVTCYPFDAIVAGGPLRYVVSAVAEQDASESPSTVPESPRPPRRAAIAAR
jgi:sortase A